MPWSSWPGNGQGAPEKDSPTSNALPSWRGTRVPVAVQPSLATTARPLSRWSRWRPACRGRWPAAPHSCQTGSTAAAPGRIRVRGGAEGDRRNAHRQDVPSKACRAATVAVTEARSAPRPSRLRCSASAEVNAVSVTATTRRGPAPSQDRPASSGTIQHVVGAVGQQPGDGAARSGRSGPAALAAAAGSATESSPPPQPANRSTASAVVANSRIAPFSPQASALAQPMREGVRTRSTVAQRQASRDSVWDS